MRWGITIALLLMPLWSESGYANQEITVDLPGGAMIAMVWIEPGTFMMGTTEEQEQLLQGKGMWHELFEDEHPAHQVTITKGFYLGKYEITQGQWEAVMGNRPWSGDNLAQDSPSNPAVDISWGDVQEFIRKINEAEGEAVYRLPTEAEWEYACRAGTSTLWSFGDDVSQVEQYAWYDDGNIWKDGLHYAQPVGKLQPNQWGLFDMQGNVWEWCQDWYAWDYYSSSSQIDPQGSTAGSSIGGRSDRALRGGGFAIGEYAQDARPANRISDRPDIHSYDGGARLLRIGPTPTSVTPRGWGEVKGGMH